MLQSHVPSFLGETFMWLYIIPLALHSQAFVQKLNEHSTKIGISRTPYEQFTVKTGSWEVNWNFIVETPGNSIYLVWKKCFLWLLGLHYTVWIIFTVTCDSCNRCLSLHMCYISMFVFCRSSDWCLRKQTCPRPEVILNCKLIMYVYICTVWFVFVLELLTTAYTLGGSQTGIHWFTLESGVRSWWLSIPDLFICI